MTTPDIHIPAKAIEAAAKALASDSCPSDLFDVCYAHGGCKCREEAAAAIRAMLANWPWMERRALHPSYTQEAIILPLTETQNDT